MITPLFGMAFATVFCIFMDASAQFLHPPIPSEALPTEI